MTLYLQELTPRRWCGYPPALKVLVLTVTEGAPDPGGVVARWPYDGTEKRRQEVLRFIEQWAAQSGITIGNPELWSLPAPRGGH